jgi:hypothetical protein
LNGTPQKERKKKWWTRAQRDEIRGNRPAEEQQKKKRGKKTNRTRRWSKEARVCNATSFRAMKKHSAAGENGWAGR